MDKGAHYYRCDLQIHTPRDINWTGQDAVTDQERRAYATELVHACRERGLNAIAITDHHDMLFVRYVRNAAAEETDLCGQVFPREQRLVVLPGMELTLGVPCQALLIFDATFPDDMFSLAMTALAITPSPDNTATTAQVRRLRSIESLDQLTRKLDEHEFLRGRYIVFPNVGENGRFSLIRRGFPGKYIEMPCVGGYVDGDLSRLSIGTRSILNGTDREWGNKRVACFQTSDNRRADHHTLGVSSTWIKWAVPTAEALRQACLAQESRISQQEPGVPSVTISSVSASNSSFLGPFDLALNPQYNSLIGGRGTGKSTILEYLRWALCDQPPSDLVESETPNYEARRRRLINNTLRPLRATVEVQFEINGVQHAIRRESEQGHLLIKIGTDEMRPCSEDEIRRLLPIQAYSQKQLSDVSVRMDELSRFVVAPIRGQLEEIDVRLAQAEEAVRETRNLVRRHRTIARLIEERSLAETSLAKQSNALRSALAGVSEEDRALIDRGESYSEAEQTVGSWTKGVTLLAEGATALRSEIVSHLDQNELAPTQPEGELLRQVHLEYRSVLSEATNVLGQLVDQARSVLDAPEIGDESPWHLWTQRLASFREAYSLAVSRSSAHSDRLQQLTTTEQELRAHRIETSRLREELETTSSVEADYSNARDEWERLFHTRDELIDTQCSELTANSGGCIRAYVKRYANPEDFVVRLKKAVSGSRVPGHRIAQIGKVISELPTEQEALALLRGVLADLEALANFDLEKERTTLRPECPALVRVGLTPSNLGGIGRTLGQDDWLALSLTPIKSEPVFEYRSREQDYIPFRNASAGQQATALLTTLLNQSGPPLIIDQPEEDLDNPIILEIVEQVWKAKKARQIIFASHNANLVVNGDAELVAWCNYRTAGDQSRGVVAGEGAIDVDDTREAIKRIMEGGEAAFNLRRAKYGF